MERPENVRTVREMEELIVIQDHAISALHAGIDALDSALYVIKKMVAERGQQNRFTDWGSPSPQFPGKYLAHFTVAPPQVLNLNTGMVPMPIDIKEI